jgi:hypothetical protein
MSSHSVPIIKKQSKNKMLVSFRVILALYSIIPICLVIQFLDIYLWGGYLKAHLPSSPSHFILFQILFGTPHIIASAMLITTNLDYFKHYQLKILGMSIALAIIFGIGSQFIPYRALYIVVASWTVYHVLKQQYGIARGVCRLPDFKHNLLLCLSVSAGILIYIGIFLNKSLTDQQSDWIEIVAGLFCIGLLVGTISYHHLVQSGFGKLFMWANTILVISSFYLYLNQYYFLAILVPRLVHDATAYLFYVTHDYNRHHDSPENFLYRYTCRLNIPIVIVLPILSFLLAFLLQAYGNDILYLIIELLFGVEIYNVVTLIVFGYLSLMHYYTESFTWKKDSPYRQYIGFKQ